MKTSTEFTNVLAAIHNVQQELEILARGETADAGKYKYKYTSMAQIWLTLKPLLKKEGLTVIQSPSATYDTQYGDFLTTGVYHSSGEWISDSMRLIITRDDPQGMGMAITYAERYMIKAIFKVVTDDDNDATTQRLADGEMKRDWVRAFTIMSKKMNPEHQPTNNEFVKFMQETYGKHPTQILAKEHQQVLDTINAFTVD